LHQPRLFIEHDLRPGLELTLPPQPAHHLLHVLRLGPGQALRLFNGHGGDYLATLVDVHARRVQVGVRLEVAGESPLQLCLLQAVCGSRRMTLILQKAVELGVASIVPVRTGRSTGGRQAAWQQKLRHWRAVIIAACEQCGRDRLPRLGEPMPFEAALAHGSGEGILLHPRAAQPLTALQPRQPALRLLSGPEGGFSRDETEAADAAGFQPVSLGPRTLRMETAPVAALAVCQALWGDLAARRGRDCAIMPVAAAEPDVGHPPGG